MGNDRASGAAAERRAADRSAVEARGDVIRYRGELTLVHASLTPAEATRADLLFVRHALDAAGIPVSLVQGSARRPVLQVDEARRAEVLDALERAMTGEPFYVARKGRNPRLARDGMARAAGSARLLRLFRPRVVPEGGLYYGAAGAVQLEFWQSVGGFLELPAENAFMRKRVPLAELEPVRVNAHGVAWSSYAPMFEARASDVPFDIDMVFSWVDGTDLEFQRARARRMKAYVVGDGDDHEARFRQIDELRYALRSVYLFAPWVRRIFIATDSPAPAWLTDHPDVTIVRSEEFFADTSVLPTHNSQGVESQLHRIPGLAEHFLYSNDDMFFGRPVSPSMFFTPGGISRFVESSTRIGLGGPDASRSGYENSARVNRELLRERLGVTITRHLEHSPAPLRKSVLEELEALMPEEFARTAASPFRSVSDISVTNSLYHYFALATGRAVTHERAKVKYVDTTTHRGVDEMQRLLAKRSKDMFCLNDGSYPELSAEERASVVGGFLERYFPVPAPWEKRDARPALLVDDVRGA
jgi:UDP-glucose 4-epimerase